MAVRQLNKTVSRASEWLELANQRTKISTEYVTLNYQEDADLLVVKFNDGKSTHSRDDMKKGIIYNYDEDDNLVSLEILDLYGIFVEA